jgi:hypothetical protein
MEKMNTLKPVKIKGDAIQPKKVLGASVNVYLKNGNEPFRFKITGCRTFDAMYLDGHDDEMLNLSIAVNDIEFITIR